MACEKRCYSSEHAAREAHRRTGFRVRAYWCMACHAYHVTNSEKRSQVERRQEERRGFSDYGEQ
jgi:hypothetical protein